MKKRSGDNKRSRYAEKKARGNQMYGPGCCAHTITATQIQNVKEQARRSGHTKGYD